MLLEGWEIPIQEFEKYNGDILFPRSGQILRSPVPHCPDLGGSTVLTNISNRLHSPRCSYYISLLFRSLFFFNFWLFLCELARYIFHFLYTYAEIFFCFTVLSKNAVFWLRYARCGLVSQHEIETHTRGGILGTAGTAVAVPLFSSHKNCFSILWDILR